MRLVRRILPGYHGKVMWCLYSLDNVAMLVVLDRISLRVACFCHQGGHASSTPAATWLDGDGSLASLGTASSKDVVRCFVSIFLCFSAYRIGLCG